MIIHRPKKNFLAPALLSLSLSASVTDMEWEKERLRSSLLNRHDLPVCVLVWLCRRRNEETALARLANERERERETGRKE